MRWLPGDAVTLRGRTWHVLHVTPFRDCEALDLTAAQGARRTYLLPFDHPKAPLPPRHRVVSLRRWVRAFRELAASTFPCGGLRFTHPRILLLPYQLEPALALLRHGATRVLVADDVGMGKTVEGGIVVKEVVGADAAARVLIVCPAGLRAQWAAELAALFSIDAFEADSAWLARSARHLPADVNPWSLPGVYLCSMDFIKRPEALRPLEDARWDLLLVDEAHAARPGSHRWAALHAVASRARRAMLLTATPHGGQDDEFEAWCGLGAESGARGIVTFARSRADTGIARVEPRAVILQVRLAAAERQAHALLGRYSALVWREARARGDADGRLVATVFRKRALSSLASLALSARRRLSILLSGGPPPPAQTLLPWDDPDPPKDDEEDDVAESVLWARGLNERGAEVRWLQEIAAAAEAASAGGGSKLRVLRRYLRRAREPAVVFSEYRDTAAALAAALTADGHRVCLVHGAMSQGERQQALVEFGRGDRLLVTTDAASEGLNLHQTCRLVIHFELPWTPLRMRQRAGRVDRIGQARRVHEVALVAAHTAEQLVIAPLLRRAAAAGRLGGRALTAQLTEARVAEQVFDGRSPDVPAAGGRAHEWPWIARMDLRRDAMAEADRIERLRRLGGAPGGARPLPARRVRPIVPVARAGSRRRRITPGTLLVIMELTIVRGAAIVERDVIGVHVVPARPWRWRRRAGPLRAQVEALLPSLHPHLSRAADATLHRRLPVVRRLERAVGESSDARRACMRASLPSAARALVQAGLFDRPRRRAPVAAQETSGEESWTEPRETDGGAATRRAGRLEARWRVAGVLLDGGS